MPSSRRRWLVVALSTVVVLAASPVAVPAVAAVPAAVAVPAARAAVAGDLAPFDAVDPFIGTELDPTQNKSNDAYGNTFPGATVPFGLVQSSPTTYREGANGEKGGYEYTATQLRGFGMTRLSGTGCTGNYGGFDFPVIPFTGALDAGAPPRAPGANIRDYYLGFSHENEIAQPGYYSVTTDNGVTTALTASPRSAVSRFDFPAGAGSATLLLNVSGSNNSIRASQVTIDPAAGRVTGTVTAGAVCNQGTYYTVHFSATFDQPFASHGVWQDATTRVGATTASGTTARHGTGAFLTFAPGATVTARIGLSYTSVENAERNRLAEVDGRSFDAVRSEARDAWRDALGAISVRGGTGEARTTFYTALYHALHHPNVFNDVNGEYVGYDGERRRVAPGRQLYVNFAGWDFYRGHAQLLAMAYPRVASDVNQSLVLMAEQTGTWYDGPTYNLVQARMAADSLPIALAAADAFGATDYDRAAALRSLLDTQRLPGDTSTRPDAYQYFATGMVENRKGNFATARVLEYAVEDFAIAQLAGRLDDDASYRAFMRRAQNWRNVFDGETGHIRPRERTGFDRSFDLRVRDDAAGRGQFNQATGYQYGWMVPHDIGGLVEARGGIEASERALDVLMAQLDAGAYTQTGNYLSNQPTFNSPWVYHWLRAPHKTTDVLRRAVAELYDTTPTGLPGNDDQGSLSSWYVWANLGIYPAIYGTADLMVSAPMFESITIDPAGVDRAYQINAPGAGGSGRYTTGLSVNGVAQSASWVGGDFAAAGGVLDFTLSAAPGTWGTGAADVPPSYDDGRHDRNNIGITSAGAGNRGSLDLSDWSLPREQLAAAGAAPGAEIAHGTTGVVFTWPAVADGEPDNWIVHGQRIDLAPTQAAAVSFLGLATNGPARGTAQVEYTDGSRQPVPVEFSDWAAAPGGGNTALVEVTGRHHRDGTSGGGTFRVFGTRPAPVDPTKTIAAVLLPEHTDRGIMHVFDVATTTREQVDPEAPTGEPWRVVLNPAQDPSTAQHVTWRTSSLLPIDGVVELRPAGGGPTRRVDATELPERTVGGYPARSHSAILSDLTPATTYEYRVGGAGRWSGWSAFTTAAAVAAPFTFLYFGDAQEGIATEWAGTVARAVAAHPDAALSMYAGDLVNTATNEVEWEDWFEANARLRTTHNVLTALGNHEIGGQPLAENFTDHFEYARNGPVASDAGEYAAGYGAHLAAVLADTVYFTDHQGVRFITLNANRDDICTLIRPPGLATFDCGVGRRAWMTAQATWLNRVLRENPHRWAVVLAHQPIFSTALDGAGNVRDEADWRQYILPVIERNDVDLVLQGHDHSYGRGHHDSSATASAGITAGPVYVVSNGGRKQYRLNLADSVWERNNAVTVRRAQDVSAYQAITVDGGTLRYESVATYTVAGGESPVRVGETLDAFTITKYDTGAKWVTEEGTEVPGPSVPPARAALPTDEPFDPATFGEVTWDDDFTTDRLDEYRSHGEGGEPAVQLRVDTAAGVLTATADGRRWSHLALPVPAGESFALIVEPARFADTGAAEDSLFLGLTDGPGNRAHSWYNHTRRESGLDVVVAGRSRALSTGPGSRAVTWQPGDRLAAVVDHGELTSWLERDGQWRPLRSGLLSLTMTGQEITGWAPTLSLRLDPGTVTIDRVTLLQREAAVPEDPAPPVWDARTVYHAGDRVTFGGAVFEALWWTSGARPDASPWGAWARVGTATGCAGRTYPAWTDSWVYEGGETVVHAGRRWQAQWYSRNQEPGGSPHGPWRDVGPC
ncbi:GH92 family glycosyl hydrolase [Micromonospora sp. WMMD1082]|uniref:GH92 family glycosyl hydrolase n=1 Tax=Micromonospora sp. WMMD1082 TaxID=3016104 RepID=UPI0024178B45|nr:GH92 family glycosyl hydrolase [Micromonospora sp. WMMD1082]MDG4797072.1 GH92 family glycosyl hydrolase [Micromonospora sp. WMMD1082]